MIITRSRLDSAGRSMNQGSSTGSAMESESEDSPGTSFNSSLDLLEEQEDLAGACHQINIPDGRLSAEGDLHLSRTVLRVEPVDTGDSNASFSIKLSTSHYAFSLKRSSSIRTLSSFYTLASILKSQHSDAALPSLPVRPLVYLQSSRSRAEQLATWLSGLLVNRLLLSNRALHLFLQTHLSIERIKENADGTRDDQVVDFTKSDRSKDGFHSLFGSSYKGSRNMLEDQQ